MSITPEQEAALDAAIANPAQSVRNANNEQIVYRPMSELLQARSVVKAEVSGASRSPYVNPTFDRGL